MKVIFICKDDHCEGRKCRLVIDTEESIKKDGIAIPGYCPYFNKECLWEIDENR